MKIKYLFRVLLFVTLFGFTLVGSAQAYDTHRIPGPRPLLRPVYPDLINWEWHHKNPYRWNIYLILSGGTWCVLVDDYWKWGDARSFAPDGGSSPVFIVGVDKNGREITRRSNVVRPDDAPIPPNKAPRHPRLSYDYGACGKK
ncbi:MAG: hypothetical protein RIT04_310 [Candidatus Parcubacteria bacterium]|jgi:hypothetical protein